jgi:hypothetical protein
MVSDLLDPTRGDHTTPSLVLRASPGLTNT